MCSPEKAGGGGGGHFEGFLEPFGTPFDAINSSRGPFFLRHQDKEKECDFTSRAFKELSLFLYLVALQRCDL